VLLAKERLSKVLLAKATLLGLKVASKAFMIRRPNNESVLIRGQFAVRDAREVAGSLVHADAPHVFGLEALEGLDDPSDGKADLRNEVVEAQDVAAVVIHDVRLRDDDSGREENGRT
jgi:hypothetical protein